MGGRVVEKPTKGELAGVNHVLAMDAKALLRELDAAWLHRFRGVIAARFPLPLRTSPIPARNCASCCVCAAMCIWLSPLTVEASCCHGKLSFYGLDILLQSVVSFEWIEECLKSGERLPIHNFAINYEKEFKPKNAVCTGNLVASRPSKRTKMSSEYPGDHQIISGGDREKELAAGGPPGASAHVVEGSSAGKQPNQYASSQSSSADSKDTIGSHGTFGIEVYKRDLKN
jgi:hypothetical protein